ncbi:site-2 protease family protein [Streptomyces alanosinicus]|uniref:Zinc metalloprotease n=1 Tax=Streptomyces alanosinicus TaxID=68171 RepID=A0A918YSJ8_9ACTN|nr:site-2 protease family protein [Streptomyces alanosinicus]GHE13554.1 zinc metalloprotease [Streptomyces alanosinicus]
MDETLPLGRIAGVRIGLHWSVLVIFALITVALAHGRLPATHPGHSPVAYWALAVLTAVVFFVSLLAHELAHAVVARRNGVQVEGITLWMLGGAARLRGEAPSPAAELRIAGVGPLTSLLAGAVFAGVAAGLHALHASGLVVEAIVWLAAINVLLAVFNALPAAPLDGGRLLRAYLWHRTGDPLRATRGASAAGRMLGWFLVASGFADVLFAGDIAGLWPALIGWFLIAAATAEARQAQLRGALTGVPVSRVMTPDPVTVPTTAALSDFLADGPFGPYRHSAFPVLGADGSVAGLLTVRRMEWTPAQERAHTTVRDVMRPLDEVVTAAPHEPVVDLVPRLQESPLHRALILDGGRLVGILTLSDITRALAWPASAGHPGPDGPRRHLPEPSKEE